MVIAKKYTRPTRLARLLPAVYELLNGVDQRLYGVLVGRVGLAVVGADAVADSLGHFVVG